MRYRVQYCVRDERRTAEIEAGSPEEAVEGWSTSDGHAHQMRGDFKMNGK